MNVWVARSALVQHIGRAAEIRIRWKVVSNFEVHPGSMSKPSVREIGEVIALLGVIASLVFVGLELRESRISARSAAYQELGIAVAENWMGRANDRGLNDLVSLSMTADSSTWAEVSPSDIYLLRSYTLANLRLYETDYLQVAQGLLRDDALETLGWGHLLRNQLLARMWPHIRSAVTPGFAEYLESEQPALGEFQAAHTLPMVLARGVR